MKSGMKIGSIICLILCFSTNIVRSQITVNNYTALTNAQAATALVDSLVGDGITFSNVSFQGVRNSGGSYGYQTCYFTTAGATATQMGIDRGIALTSGNTNLISIGMATNPGATNSFSKGYISSSPGELRKTATPINDMTVLAGAVNWYNGAILEFDFIPTGDSIVFKYVFGGEEYSDNTNFTNYQCSQYNDKFGFLISGPGIAGGAGYTSDARNIARLSNGSEVGINSVNNGTVGSSGTPNGPSYCTNANSSWTNGTPTPEFNGTIAGTAPNGNTDVLFAAQGGLTPGQTYHIKLLICDATDGAYDAIVYIEAGSFTSPAPTLSLTANPSTICNGDNTWVVATLTNGTPPFTYSWSNGTIHNSSNMADSIQVSPAANTTYSITVTDATAATFTDSQLITVNGLTTPTFTALGPYCRLASPAALPATSTNGITGTWSPATISTATVGSTTYNFTSNAGQCASNTTMSVTVNALPTAGITNNSATTVLTCTQTAISVTATGGSSYAWSGGSTPATAANSLTTAGTYTVTVTNAAGCTATSAITITGNTTPPVAGITNNSGTTVVTCSTPSISVTATGGGTYNWGGGITTPANSFTAAGTYTVTVTAANGCTDTESITITQNTTPPTAGITNNTGSTVLTCTLTTISVTATGGGTYNWGGGITTAARNLTAAGTYTVTVTAANGCTDTESITITSNTTPPAAAITNNTGTTVLNCTTTTINVTATGGGTYNWGGGITTAANSFTTAGTYTVTVTGANGCTATASITITGNTTPPVAGITNNSGTTVVTCSTPSISVTATGGGTYNWGGGITTAANSFSTAGTYTVTVTAANGCTDTESITITTNTTPPTAGITNNTGSTVLTCTLTTISVTATGGGTYNWGGGITTAARNLTAAGTYTVTVTAANGCTDTESITITSNTTPPAAAITNNTGTTILNCTTTTINVTATGGGTYNWGGGITTAANSFTTAGTYTVTVTGANGCTATAAITITGNTTPPVAGITNNSGTTVVTCSTPSISVTATGGGTYNWGGGITTAANSFTLAGTYTVTVTAANGCTDTESITITTNTTPPTAGITNNTGSTILTCTLTTISVTATGGGTYNWGGGITTAARNLTAAGTYTVTVTSANGCTDTESITITSNTTPPAAAITNNTGTTVLNCTTTTINVTATGGGTYNWGGGITTAANSFTAAGTYTVTVTGANGCTATSAITITGNTTPPVAGITNNSGTTVVTCSTPSISVTATGGGTYNWGGGVTTAANSFTAAGTYTVTVTAANGCTDTESITISQNTTPPTAGITNNTGSTILTCTLTTISATATGGGTYNWGGGIATAARNLTTAGTYTVTVTAANGCTDTESITITQNVVLPTATITNNTGTTILDCNTTQIQVIAGGGNTYSWSGGNSPSNANNSFNTPGNYIVTVTNASGCTDTESITITQNITPPVATITNNTGSTQLTCTVLSINVSAGTGISYLWNGGATTTTANNSFTVPGNYFVTVIGSNGCTNSANISITQNTVPPVAVITNNTGLTELNCLTTTISLTSTGGSNYLWNSGTSPNSSSNLANTPGTYTVTVTGINGCTDTESVTITQNTTIPVATITNNSATTQLDCHTSSITLTAGGGLSYQWNSGSNLSQASNTYTSPGNYTVTVTAANGCTDSETINITQVTPLSVSLTSTNANCGSIGGSISANISAGSQPYNVLWSNAAISTNLNDLDPGNYSVTVTDDDGCTATATTTVSTFGTINTTITQTQLISCGGENTGILSATTSSTQNPFTYSWSNGGLTASINNLFAGTYSITITDNWGCTGSSSSELINPAGMNINANTNDISCNGESNGSIYLTVNGGNSPYSYNWNNSNTSASLSGLVAGVYTVTVSDNINCTLTESFTVSEPEKLVLDIIKEDVKCYGTATGKISLTAIGGNSPYNYGIDNGISNASGRIHSNLYAGAYSVYVTDNSGCSVQNDILLYEPAQLNISHVASNPTCRDNNDGFIEILTSGGTAPYLYSWGGLIFDTCLLSGLEQGVYDIVVTDVNNCTDNISSVILTDNPVDCIRIPNAFTPNGDGINDTWIIENIELFPDATISVFNRWGQMLYQAQGDADAWDGKYNDRFVPTGSYIYIIDLHRGTKSYNGVVTVIY